MVQNPIITTAFVALLTSLGGWIFLYIGLAGLREARNRQQKERARATALVVDYVSKKHIYRHRRRSGVRQTRVVTLWKPVVEFTVDGKTCRFESREPFQREKLPVGSHEDVLYDPDDPAHFHLRQIHGRDMRNAWVCTAIGIAIFVFAFFATRDICSGL